MNATSAERDYDRMLAAGPPEPPLHDITVNYIAPVDPEHLDPTSVARQVGGDAAWTSGTTEGLRELRGDTVVEDIESAEAALEVVQTLLTQLAPHLDVENLVLSAEEVFPPEPDWDAIEKDRRLEEEF